MRLNGNVMLVIENLSCLVFLSRIVTSQRAKFRKLFNIRHTRSGYSAACTKFKNWDEIFAVFTKESEFETDAPVESIKAENDSSQLFSEPAPKITAQSGPISPFGNKRVVKAMAAQKKQCLVESTLKVHLQFGGLSESFRKTNAVMHENQILKNMALRRELGCQ